VRILLVSGQFFGRLNGKFLGVLKGEAFLAMKLSGRRLISVFFFSYQSEPDLEYSIMNVTHHPEASKVGSFFDRTL
jgi:hypothetical protein